MKITFLGTAAAEGVPAVFCNCDICIRAKTLGGKDIRTRSQILIGDDVLLDFPMDTYYHMIQNKLDLSKIGNVFITHAHMDHCYPQEFTLHGYPYAHKMTEPVINIHANATVIKKVRKQIKSELKKTVSETLFFNVLKPYQTVDVNNLTVTALPACHTAGENCFIYLITEKDKTFLQFNDSGILDDEVYKYLAKNNITLSCVAYDCTYGYMRKGAGRHMGLLDNADERKRMEAYGVTDNNTLHILTHFSHNSGLLYEEMLKTAEVTGFTTAYDGMIIEI